MFVCRLAEDCEHRIRAMHSLDVCSPQFSSSRAEEVVRGQRDRMLCDVLLDQTILPGVGNIIKNEALFDSGHHPAVKVHNYRRCCCCTVGLLMLYSFFTAPGC